MGTTERRDRHRTSLRRHILDAARALFVEEGYDAVSMRKVAARIEYSPTTIYLHFKDKDELFMALADEAFARLSKRLEALMAEVRDPVEGLREGLRTYARFGLRNREHYTIAFMLPRGPGAQYGFKGSSGENAFNYLRQSVAACVEQGAFRPVDVEATAQSLWAATHGVVALVIAKCNFPFVKVDRLVDDTIDTLIRGLRAA